MLNHWFLNAYMCLVSRKRLSVAFDVGGVQSPDWGLVNKNEDVNNLPSSNFHFSYHS